MEKVKVRYFESGTELKKKVKDSRVRSIQN